jgi:hypothetical protein
MVAGGKADLQLAEAFKAIESGTFGDGHIYEALLKTVYEHDHYLVRIILHRTIVADIRYPTTLDLTSRLKLSSTISGVETIMNGISDPSRLHSPWELSVPIGPSRIMLMGSGLVSLLLTAGSEC